MISERFTNNFDLLRVFAAVCIALTHSFNLLAKDAEEPLMKLTNQQYDFSFVGLCLFFTISGYLITKSSATSPSVLNYCWKRLLRIQPLLIVVTILTIFLLGPIFTSQTNREYFSSLSTYTYLRNVFPATGIQFTLPGVFEKNPGDIGVNGSLWTLIVEERLYIFTIIIFYVKKMPKFFYIAFILLLNIGYFIATSDNKVEGAWINSAPVFYALIFLNAGVLYLINIGKFLFRFGWTSWLVSIGFIFITLLFPQLKNAQIISIPVFLLFLAFIKGFTNRAGRYGDFTYGLYLFAFPVQQMLIYLFRELNPWLLFFYTILFCLPLAIISWHLLEKRMLRLKSGVL